MRKRTLIAIIAVLLLSSGTAMADLTGTSLDLQLSQTGLAGMLAGPSGGSYEYGTVKNFVLPTSLVHSWNAISAGGHPMYDNSLLVDLTAFSYASYVPLGPNFSTLDVINLSENVEAGSVRVFLPTDLFTDIAQSTSVTGDAFSAMWSVDTVFNSNPIAPTVVVAWNSTGVPAPGSLALLSLAAISGRRRRRRS